MTPQETKQNFAMWLQAIRSRAASFSFRLVQSRLSSAGMPSASGWIPLLTRYAALNYSDPNTDFALYQRTLVDIHRCATLFGTSAVWLFDSEGDDLEHLRTSIQYAAPAQSPFSRDFPFVIPEDELSTQEYKTTPVREIELDGGALASVACGKRRYREREQVAADDVPENARAALGIFSELILVRTGFTQAFDRLIFKPAANRLELHVDLCCPLNAEELDQFKNSYVARLKQLGKQIGRKLDWLDQPVNLFPFIAHLYNDSGGMVLSLGHATGTKSIKEERMRGQRLDLREELFHKHGIQAIQGTDAFSIRKGWESVAGRHTPSITIPSHFTMASSPSPRANYAVLENCALEADYHNMMSHLP